MPKETVRELYERKTGKKWHTAKSEGLTDGSYEKNMALAESFKETTSSFSDTFKKERDKNGAGSTFDFQGKTYSTNTREDSVKKEEVKDIVKTVSKEPAKSITKKQTQEEKVLETESHLKNYFPKIEKEEFKYSGTQEVSKRPVKKEAKQEVASAKEPLKNYFPDIKEEKFKYSNTAEVSRRPEVKAVKKEVKKQVQKENLKNYFPDTDNPVFNKIAGEADKSYKPYVKKEELKQPTEFTYNKVPEYSYRKPSQNQSAVIKSESKNALPKNVPLMKEEGIFDTIKKASSAITGFISDSSELARNGVERYLNKNGYTTDNDEKVVQKSPLTAKEYYDQSNSSGTQTTIDAPKTKDRTYKQESLSTGAIEWGYRNRGNYKNIKTDGLEVTSFEPFSSKNIKEGSSVIALDTITNKMKAGNSSEFKGKPNYVFAKTYMNKITGFNYDKSGSIVLKSGSVSGNSGFQQPTVNTIDKNGKKVVGSLNVLLKDSNSKDYYGSVQGGRILLKDPATGKTTLVAGSLNHIEKEFTRLKGDSPYLEAYTLDNGTYARGLSNKSKNLTGKDLRSYDNENTSGGNGLYIKSYDSKPSKFEQKIVDNMPNIRTKDDDSFKKGHSIRNEQLNMILHHTAYTDPNTSEKAVNKQYMAKGNSSSHVVIQENGKRTIYASPEQVTFHSGKSSWKGRGDVNDFGIGVEFQGDTNKKPLTNEQIDSFIEYYETISGKTKMSLKNIITHQMIAPGRKPDITNKEYQRVLDRMKKTGHR